MPIRRWLSCVRRPRAAAPLVALALAATLVAAPGVPHPGPGRVSAQGPAPLTAAQVAHRSVDVFGYLPWWELDASTDGYLRYDVLNTIALFGVSFRPDGSFNTTDSGYAAVTSGRAAGIIAHAHAAGVRVVVSFESFSLDHNAQFLSDPDAQSTFIANAVALLRRLGADGANVDIEMLSGAYFDEYGAFVGAFRQAVLAYDTAAQVSVATNASSSGSRMARQAVDNGADRAFIMGYDYRSAGTSPAGSIDPLIRSGSSSLTSTADLYQAAGVPANRLILGLPLYGRTWPTVSSALRAARQAASTYKGGAPMFPTDDLADASRGATVAYDTAEQSAVLMRWDAALKTWTQTYWDDPASLAPKLQLALRRGYAGVGMWALGFDQGVAGYWPLFASLHRGLEISRISVAPFATRSSTVSVTIGWKSAGHAVTGIRLSNDGRSWSGWRAPTATQRWSLAGGADGRRTVYVQVRDASGAVSTIRPVDAVLDRAGPVVTTLTLAWSSSAAKWVSTYHEADVSRVTAYQFRHRIGAGAWHLLSRGPDDTVVRIGASKNARVTVQVRAKDVLGQWGPWRTISRP